MNCYVCDDVHFFNESKCYTDRLSRKGKTIDEVWDEFLKMEEGKGYSWENRWNPEICPFLSWDEVWKFVTESPYSNHRTKECDDGSVIVMTYKYDLYFVNRIRNISDDELMTIVRQYSKFRKDRNVFASKIDDTIEKLTKMKKVIGN